MKNYSTKSKTLRQQLKEFLALCHCAATSLGISEGEFWVWYGNPFVLQCNHRK